MSGRVRPPKRNMRRLLLILVLFFVSFAARAQTKFTVNGYVKDSLSGESIIGATVAINGRSVTSNQYGFYSLTLDTGTYELSVSHVSYVAYSQQIPNHKDISSY